MQQQLGPYQVREVIGKGGMGAVYNAYHASLDRHVAIKVLSARFSADPSFVERFKKEAQIIARLEHPHILPVYDFAFDGNTAYLVMKLVKGTSLTSHITRRGMPPERMMKVLDAVAQALSHAHRRNIIHRDIKPDNILIDENDWVYLSDFGMAKLLTNADMTQQGLIMGTPEYMAPEQALGHSMDHRADVYSLGVLIFHMLTGTLPFKSHNPMSTIRKAVNEPFPDITSRNPSLPKLLDSVLQKGTAKNPYDRFGDVMELAQMVTAVLSSAEMQDTSDLGVRKYRIAVVPFSSPSIEKNWMGDAVQEMLNFEFSQSRGFFTIPGDHVTYICRNLLEPNSSWSSSPLQRFFDLSKADYMVLGRVGENQIEYELKISTSFETVDQQTVEGTIPFHLVSEIAKRIKAKVQVKDNRILSVEQIFHGNISLLEQYAIGIRKFRDGRFVDAERAMELALTFEPSFAPAHLYLSRALATRGLRKHSKRVAETALSLCSELPEPIAILARAKCFELMENFKRASEVYLDLHKQSPYIFEYLALLAESLASAGNSDEAANICYQICEMEAKSGFGWRRLATIESTQEKYEQAWYHFKRAERLYQSKEHNGGLAACYSGLAEISEKRNEWTTAIDYLKRSIDAFSKLKWAKGIARSKYELAVAYKKESVYQEVLPLLMESLKSYEEIGDFGGQISCLRELLSEPLNVLEALELSDRALEIAAEMEEPSLIASFIPLKLRWLVEAKQPDAALEFYASRYDQLLENSQILYFPLSQIQVARALILQERYPEARQQIEQPIQTFSITGNQRSLADALLTCSQLHFQENDQEGAHRLVQEANSIAEKLADNELLLEVHLMKSHLLKAEGNTIQLLQLFLNMVPLAESLGRYPLAQSIQANINELKV